MGNSGGRTVVGVLRGDGAVGFTVQSSTNRYTSIGGNSISHDDAGNLTVDKDGYKYFYDYENRVVRIQKPDGLGGWDDVAQMAYDTLGRRIRVIDSVASTTTLYYYNPEWQCLAEYSGAGTLQRYFVYGNYIDEPLVMNDGTDNYYYAQDHLYSTAALIDDGGSVVERYEYDAYGTVLVFTDDGNDDTWFTGDDTTAASSAIGNSYTFTGRRLDVLDAGNLVRMHYRRRDYDVHAGRFVQQDPLAYVDGLNCFEYTKSNPILSSDPLGTCTEFAKKTKGGKKWKTGDFLKHYCFGKDPYDEGDAVDLDEIGLLEDFKNAPSAVSKKYF
jgi:RHS repeat-associated protein